MLQEYIYTLAYNIPSSATGISKLKVIYFTLDGCIYYEVRFHADSLFTGGLAQFDVKVIS